jgi:hypothetical protein
MLLPHAKRTLLLLDSAFFRVSHKMQRVRGFLLTRPRRLSRRMIIMMRLNSLSRSTGVNRCTGTQAPPESSNNQMTVMARMFPPSVSFGLGVSMIFRLASFVRISESSLENDQYHTNFQSNFSVLADKNKIRRTSRRIYLPIYLNKIQHVDNSRPQFTFQVCSQ